MTKAGPHYGWYGDDFTGATDTLATIAERGHRAFLFLSIPDDKRLAAVGPLDAIGLAGAARAMDNQALAAELAPVGPFFGALGVKLVHYKCCSTFDSSARIGNLAVAVETLRAHVDHPSVAIVGGQPSLGRYCLFSNLFAAANDEVFRLDRHPTMSRHPSTPMNEADLGWHLANLGLQDIGAVTWPMLDTDPTGASLPFGRSGALLFDAATPTHIDTIGAVLRRESLERSMLVLGASSVAEAYFPQRPARERKHQAASGPVLAISGSLSPMSRKQVAAARRFDLLPIAPQALQSQSDMDAVVARATALLAEGCNVLLSSLPPDGTRPTGAMDGFAGRCAALMAGIVARHPVRRMAIAGGDTSSHVTQALGLWGLAFSHRLGPGTSVCTARFDDDARDGMQIMLKGGQMGTETLFDSFAEGVAVVR